MDAYRVIRQPGDEDERVRWACGARRQRGPVEIALGPASAALRFGADLAVRVVRERNLFIPPLVGAAKHVATDGSPGRTDDGRDVRDFKLEPTVREV